MASDSTEGFDFQEYFKSLVKPLPAEEIADHLVLVTPVPSLAAVAARIDPASYARITEIWEATIRLETAMKIVVHFYGMFENGKTFSATAQETISQYLPELSGLKSLFDELAHWPSRHYLGVIPPPGSKFPEAGLTTVMQALPFVIERDARLLEIASAIPIMRTPDDRPTWEGIGFEPASERYPSRRYRSVVRIGDPSIPQFDHVLIRQLKMFRERMMTSPIQTLASLTPPISGNRGASPVCEISQDARHSEDFRSVDWYGTQHFFTATQAVIVRKLWDAWKNGTPVLGSATLLEAADAGRSTVRDLFKGNAAWGTMVADVEGRRGSYRLQPPRPTSEI